MTQISKFVGEGRYAIVDREDTGGYSVSMYMDNRLLQKARRAHLEVAESLAEDFVTGDPSSMVLLNEEKNW